MTDWRELKERWWVEGRCGWVVNPEAVGRRLREITEADLCHEPAEFLGCYHDQAAVMLLCCRHVAGGMTRGRLTIGIANRGVPRSAWGNDDHTREVSAEDEERAERMGAQMGIEEKWAALYRLPGAAP